MIEAQTDRLDSVAIDCDFPGGNIVVDSIDGSVVYVHQDLRTTTSDWFYWAFRVQPNGHTRLTVTFTGSEAVGVRGPAMSLDEGRTWQWLGAESGDSHRFVASLPTGISEARFSFGMPYVLDNLQQFVAKHVGNPSFETTRLTTSENGRDVDLWHVGRIRGSAKHRVLLTCRHHSCEMMASYALEGLIDGVLAENATGEWLRTHVEFHIVPMVDVDGVEEGDQGKWRAPHDHNRDYGDRAQIYASIRALRSLALDPSQRPISFAMDMHCPAMSGPDHESIYFVGTPDQSNWMAIEEISRVLEGSVKGPLPYSSANNMPFGRSWNVQNEPELVSFGTFMDTVPGAGPHATLELPYANASGAEVNVETARAFGRDLAEMIHHYLRDVGASRATS